MKILQKRKLYMGLSIAVCAVCLTMGQPALAAERETAAAGTSVAGISVALEAYYNAFFSGEMTREAEFAVKRVATGKASVLEGYTNLGIANVEGYLNVREEPGKDGTICGKMLDGDACEILEGLDGWYHISSGPVNGYVSADFILTGVEAQDRALDEADLRAIVLTDGLRLRETPDTSASILDSVGNQERYLVLENDGSGWVKIQVDSLEGYVSSEYVEVKYALGEAVEFSPIDESPLRSGIVNFALQYLGNPYVWGGTSLTNGIDCSGFTMRVMGNFGISLTHYSGAQANEGRTIDVSEIRPGDLLFYASSGRIDHVAIYIGNGQIVHASSPTTGIIISGAFNRTFVKAVNVIGD